MTWQIKCDCGRWVTRSHPHADWRCDRCVRRDRKAPITVPMWLCCTVGGTLGLFIGGALSGWWFS